MPRTVILGAARTPVGKLGGGLSSLHPTDLGGIAIKCALERADVAPEQVQHVVMGQVLQAGTGQIPSRPARIEAGIPIEVTSETVNKVGARRRRPPRARLPCARPGSSTRRCGRPRRRSASPAAWSQITISGTQVVVC